MTHPVFFSSLLHTDLQFTTTTATARGKYFSILLKTLNGGRMTVRMIKADDDDKSNTLLSGAEQLYLSKLSVSEGISNTTPNLHFLINYINQTECFLEAYNLGHLSS